MQRSKLQAIVGENLPEQANFLLVRVIEMAAAGEQLDGLESRVANLGEHLRCEFFGDKEVGREDSLHALQCSASQSRTHGLPPAQAAGLAKRLLAGNGITRRAILVAGRGAFIARIGGPAALPSLPIDANCVDQPYMAAPLHVVAARLQLFFHLR